MLRKSIIALSLTTLFSASSFAAISAEQALTIAEQQGKGQAIGFKQEQNADKSVFAVQLIGENGFQRLWIDAQSGAVLPQEKPSFSAPAISLKQALAIAEKEGTVLSIHYHDGERMPHHAHGKDDRGHRAQGEGKARTEKPDNQADAPAEKRPALYFVTLEKEGKVEHKAISAEDGSFVELPKRPEGFREGARDGDSHGARGRHH